MKSVITFVLWFKKHTVGVWFTGDCSIKDVATATSVSGEKAIRKRGFCSITTDTAIVDVIIGHCLPGKGWNSRDTDIIISQKERGRVRLTLTGGLGSQLQQILQSCKPPRRFSHSKE